MQGSYYKNSLWQYDGTGSPVEYLCVNTCRNSQLREKQITLSQGFLMGSETRLQTQSNQSMTLER